MSTIFAVKRLLILAALAICSSSFIFTACLSYAATPPEDVDYGIVSGEQQGGGGLVGESVRIFNGNVIEFREDLRFSSPNRLGLVFQAAYNSRSSAPRALGYGWTHTYESSLNPSYDIDGITYIGSSMPDYV